MAVQGTEEAAIDFDGAETFLKVAREAHQEGDARRCAAACKLVAVALNLNENSPPVRMRTQHLKDDAGVR